MSNNQKITDFSLISTNQDYNVLNDVTRGDIVDILDNIFLKSKASKINEILEQILEHTKDIQESDPHGLSKDSLSENVLDKIYEFWLNRGNNGSLDDLKEIIYRFIKYANELNILNNDNDNYLTVSAKEVYEYLKNNHDVVINSYEPISLISISEKEHNWSGELSGVEIQTNKTIISVSDETPTIYPNSNGESFYIWNIIIPKKFYNGILKIKTLTNKSFNLYYKIINQHNDWIQIQSTIIEDSSITPIYENTNIFQSEEIEISESIEILFKITWGENTRKVITEDIQTIIDVSKSLTDDPEKNELYRNPPHENKLANFVNFDKNIYEYPKFSWSHIVSETLSNGYFPPKDSLELYLNSKNLQNNIHWFNHLEGSFLLTAQTNSNLYSDINNTIYKEVILQYFNVSGETTNNNSLITISSVIGGLYEKHNNGERNELATMVNDVLTFATSFRIARVDSIKFYIHLKYNNNNITIITPNLISINRPLWKMLFTYDTVNHLYRLYYLQDSNTIKMIEDASLAVLKFNMLQWRIFKPARIYDNSFVGIHQLDYWNKVLTNENHIKDILSTDMRKIPYL